jgi:multidrug efflux pump
MRQGFGARIQKPVQFVLGGGTYEELAAWRDILLAEIEKTTRASRASTGTTRRPSPSSGWRSTTTARRTWGSRSACIGRTLETMLGSRKVTTYLDAGEEYDVILEGERERPAHPREPGEHLCALGPQRRADPALQPGAGLEVADSKSLNRYNRLRAITIEANLADGLALGQALDYLEGLARTHLPEQARIDYKGQSGTSARRGAASCSSSPSGSWWSSWCWRPSSRAGSTRW